MKICQIQGPNLHRSQITDVTNGKHASSVMQLIQAVLTVKMHGCSLLYLLWSLDILASSQLLVYFPNSTTCRIFGTEEKDGGMEGCKKFGLNQDMFMCLSCKSLVPNFKMFQATVLSFPNPYLQLSLWAFFLVLLPMNFIRNFFTPYLIKSLTKQKKNPHFPLFA